MSREVLDEIKVLEDKIEAIKAANSEVYRFTREGPIIKLSSLGGEVELTVGKIELTVAGEFIHIDSLSQEEYDAIPHDELRNMFSELPCERWRGKNYMMKRVEFFKLVDDLGAHKGV